MVAVDAVQPGATGAQGTHPLSWTHTPVGTPTAVIVGVVEQNGDPTDLITGIVSATYGGTAMTRLGGVGSNNSTSGGVVLFGLLAPAPGPQTVVATVAAGSSLLISGSISLVGAISGFDTAVIAFGDNSSGSSPPRATVPNMVSGDLAIDVSADGALGFSGIGCLGTLLWGRDVDGATAAGNGMQQSYTGTGSITVGSTPTGHDWWSLVAVRVIASGGAPAPVYDPVQPQIPWDLFNALTLANDLYWSDPTQTAVNVTVVDDYSAQAALAADILPAEQALSDMLAAVDVPLGGLAAGFTTESVIVDVTVTDGPSGALAGNVVETLAVDQILTDSPSGALAAAVGESASIGVTITDSAFGALAASVTESAIVDVTVTDSPAAALGHVQPQEAADSVTLVVDTPSAALGASVSESVAADVLTPVDAPSAALGHSQPGETAGAVVIVTDTAPLAAIGGNPSESVAIDIVVTDNPAASVAAQAIESAAVGITISDQPSAALAAGGTREVVTIDIIILDTPSGVIAAITTDGQVAAGVTVSDSPLASLAGGALAEEQASQGAPDIVIFDTVHAALAAAWQEVARAAGPADITAHIRTATVSTHVAAATVAAHIAAGQISSVIEEGQVDSHVMQANIESHVRG